MPELSISTEQVGFLILKAREFDAKEEVPIPTRDRMRQMTA